jgi:NADPH:quinone reductase-like Zn-dependent oxidoreductase
VAAGTLSTRVAQTFPASEARAAYEAAGAKGLRGRIVLTF